MASSAPGWYPDPKTGGMRYFDGNDWTDKTAPASPSSTAPADPASEKKPLNGFKAIAGIVGALLVLGLLSKACGSADKKDSSEASRTTSSSASSSSHAAAPSRTTTATPTGPSNPGASFVTGPDGSVTATFDITDSLTEGLIKSGARYKTIDVLKYASKVYPTAPQVEVIGRFPMKDSFGNTTTDDVIDLVYLRGTLDKINFDGIDKDRIWEIRDYGTIYPAFQP